MSRTIYNGTNGCTATVTSSLTGHGASLGIDGYRHTRNAYSTNGCVTSGNPNSTPQVFTVMFPGNQLIDTLRMFTIANAVNYITDPTTSTSASSYGNEDMTFEVLEVDGTTWTNKGTVTANDKALVEVSFTAGTYKGYRITCTKAHDANAYFIECEAEGDAVADTTAPTVVSAQVKNSAKNQIEVILSENLDEASVSANSAFTVSGGKSVTAISVAGNKIIITVNSNYAYGDTITFAYNQPSSNKIRDLAATPNNLANVSTHAVTNNIDFFDATPIVVNKISGTYGNGNTIRLKAVNCDTQAFWDIKTGAGAFSNFDHTAKEVDFTQSGSTVPVIRCSTNPFKVLVIGTEVNGVTLQTDGNLKCTNAANNSFSAVGAGVLNNNGDYAHLEGVGTAGDIYLHALNNADSDVFNNSQGAGDANRLYVLTAGSVGSIQYRHPANTVDGGAGFQSWVSPLKAKVVIVNNLALNTIIKRFEYGNDNWATSGNVYGVTNYKETLRTLDASGETVTWTEILPNDTGWSGGSTGSISGPLNSNPTSIAESVLLNYRKTTSSMTWTKTGTPNSWVKIELYFASDEQIKATDIFQEGVQLAKVRFGYDVKKAQLLFGWLQFNSSGNLILTFSKNVIGSTNAIFNYGRLRPETPNFSAITHEVYDEGHSTLEPYQYDYNDGTYNYKGLSRLLAEYFGGNLKNHRLFEIYDPANKVNFVNLHNAGEKIADISATKTDQIISKYNTALTQLLLIQGVSNDYASSEATNYSSLTGLLNTIKSACALLKIFVIGETPRWEDTAHNLEAFNNLMRSNTDYQGFIDHTIDYDYEANASTAFRDYPYWVHYTQGTINRIFNKVVAAISYLMPGVVYAITGDNTLVNSQVVDFETNVPSPVWSKTGSGSINTSTGAYTAPGSGSGSVTIRAQKSTDSSIFAELVITYSPSTPAPTSSFTKSATGGVAPVSITFTDTSTGTPTSWAWNFGDGGTSASQNPSHSYTTSGTYTVSFTPSNASGAGSTVTQTVVITSVPPPVAGFSLSGLTSGNLPAGEAVAVVDSSTGTGRTYQYQITNGVYTNEPCGSVASPNIHSKIKSGINTVKQIVTNGGGSSNTTQSFTAVDKEIVFSSWTIVSGKIHVEFTAEGTEMNITAKIKAKNSANLESDYSNEDGGVSG